MHIFLTFEKFFDAYIELSIPLKRVTFEVETLFQELNRERQI